MKGKKKEKTILTNQKYVKVMIFPEHAWGWMNKLLTEKNK